MNNQKIRAIPLALLAAALYAVNIPLSKVLLSGVGPVFMAAFLYFGAGLGMAGLTVFQRDSQPSMTRAELPYIVGMILLDIAAPICLMLGLNRANPANVALLNNFEIVATSVLALCFFREKISGLMWTAIGLMTAASILLTFDGVDSLRFSSGSLFVLAACLCWGLENNCTRRLAEKSAAHIVILKGIFSGAGSFVVALLTGEAFPAAGHIAAALALGFVSYGLSIFFYVRAQKELGAACTSACYAINPFIGALLSMVMFQEALPGAYWAALLIMAAGAGAAALDTMASVHDHPHVHVVGYDGNGEPVTLRHSHPHRHFAGHSHRHRHLPG